MNDIITLTCPSCGARINIPEGATRFTCDYCGNEHLLQFNVQAVTPTAASAATAAAAATAATAAAAQAIKPRVPTPQSVHIVKDAQGARIIQRWFSFKYIPLAFFAAAWDSFLIFWYSMALGSHAPWIFIVFPIAHLAVGIGVTYSVLTGFLNHTTVELTRSELSVYFDPLPWLGEKTIPTPEIKQLFCKESVSSGKNGPSYSYQLYAITQDDRQVKLISNLDSPDVARFFEQQLETWLRITDQPVLGEMSK